MSGKLDTLVIEVPQGAFSFLAIAELKPEQLQELGIPRDEIVTATANLGGAMQFIKTYLNSSEKLELLLAAIAKNGGTLQHAAANAIPATCEVGAQPADNNTRAHSKYMLSIIRHVMGSEPIQRFGSWRALLTHMGYTPQEIEARLLSNRNNGMEYMYPRFDDSYTTINDSNTATNDKALRHLLLYLYGAWW